MLLSPLILAALPAARASDTSSEHPQRELIVGGAPVQRIIGGGAIDAFKLPWIISIYDEWRGGNICGGTLISDRFVLTAAHCLDASDHGRYKVDVHRHELSASDEHRCAERIDVIELNCHHAYNQARARFPHDSTQFCAAG